LGNYATPTGYICKKKIDIDWTSKSEIKKKLTEVLESGEKCNYEKLI